MDGALQKMQAAGFRLEAIGGQLKVSPADRLNPQQREYLKRHREELLAALDTPPATITRAMLEARPPLGWQGCTWRKCWMMLYRRITRIYGTVRF